MPDDDTLQSYIDSQRALGVTDGAIRSALLSNQWETSMIDTLLQNPAHPDPVVHIPKPIQFASILLGLLSVGEFVTGLGILLVTYTLNTSLSKGAQAPPYEFIRYLNGLLIKGISSPISGIAYAYLAMRVRHLDTKIIGITITTIIGILALEVVTGTIAMQQLQTIYKVTSVISGG